MMNSKRWIQRGVLCGLLLTGFAGCSTLVSSPPSQIASTDHAALAAWYDKEAAHLRQKAEDMKEMEAVYGKNPAYGQGMMGGIGKTDFRKHCEGLIAFYTKGVEQADQLAKGHRGMVK